MVARTSVAFDTGVGSQTLNYELGKLDFSNANWIRLEVALTKSITDAGDTCDIYLQCRGGTGFWEDRIHLTQLLGNLTTSVSAPEILVANLQPAGTLADAEEVYEPSGSAGGSRLTVGTVKNGTFPGKYWTGGALAASWRIQIVVVDADNDADFEGTCYVSWDETI